jgi:hypothetical protein
MDARLRACPCPAIRDVRNVPVTRALMLRSAVVMFFASAPFALLPAVAHAVSGSAIGYGVLLGCFGVGRAGYFARPHDFQSILRIPTRSSESGCVARSREKSTTQPGSPASIGCRPVIAPGPRYRIGAVRKATDSRTRAVRRSPRGSSFQLPMDLDIARNLGGDGGVLRDVSAPLEGGRVP